MKAYAKKIRDQWLTFSPSTYWGDNIDLRFYALYRVRQFIHNQTVLDLGCNSGLVLSELDSSNLKIGIDIDFDFLKTGQQSFNEINYICASFENLPFKPQIIDAIIGFGILEVPGIDRIQLLEEFRKISKNETYFFFTTTNRNHHRYKKHKEKITLQEIEALFKNKIDIQILGWNPFPPFPFFFPNHIVHKIPFIWKILIFLSKFSFLKTISTSFLITSKNQNQNESVI